MLQGQSVFADKGANYAASKFHTTTPVKRAYILGLRAPTYNAAAAAELVEYPVNPNTNDGNRRSRELTRHA